jgi:elongator complex protein 4
MRPFPVFFCVFPINDKQKENFIRRLTILVTFVTPEMSSFKRKGSAPATSNARQLPPGTRASANSPTVAYLSSGIASLDDVLGGGIPLGSVIVILAPDVHSAWGTLLQRYFIAQGIVLNQHVAIVSKSHDASELVKGCMWLPASSSASSGNTTSGSGETADDLEDEAIGSEDKIKIAWRYEKMQQFQTTVGTTFSCMHACSQNINQS